MLCIDKGAQCRMCLQKFVFDYDQKILCLNSAEFQVLNLIRENSIIPLKQRMPLMSSRKCCFLLFRLSKQLNPNLRSEYQRVVGRGALLSECLWCLPKILKPFTG